MELRKVRGNTWVLEADELIPLYQTDERHCILLDSGLGSEREELTDALERARLTPVGVFGSHAHRDHWANSFYLRERCGARLSLPEGEAALCLNAMMYRAAYDTSTPRSVEDTYGDMIGRVDEAVGPDDGTVTFCGVPFEVIHTPGHTPDHICTATPDGVLYVADALLGEDFLLGAKLPYHYTHEVARRSVEKLRRLRSYGAYIMAHRSVTEELGALADRNLQVMDSHYEILAGLIDRPMTQDEILLAAMRHYRTFTSKEVKAARYDRNVRTTLEYLLDTGRVSVSVREGVRYYRRVEA